MRIYLASMAHPKRLSKRLAKLTDVSLSISQFTVARMLGYKDWHELEQVVAAGRHAPSSPDYLHSREVAVTRETYQAERLSEAIPHLELEAYQLVDALKPTSSMPWDTEEHSPAMAIFPSVWEATDEDEISPTKSTTRFRVDNGALGLLDKANAKITAGSSAREQISTERGYRVFALACEDQSNDDLLPSEPVGLILVVRLTPMIDANIIVGVEIDVHPLSFGSAYLNDDEVRAAADAFAAYLHHSGLHVDSPGEYSGSARGIRFDITGVTVNPMVYRVAQSIRDHLELAQTYCEDGADPLHGGPYVYGQLPVSSVTFDLNDDSDDDANQEVEFADAVRLASDQMLAISGAMKEAPAILARYLRKNGRDDLAEFAEAQQVAEMSQWPDWLAFVRGIEKTGVLPPTASIALRHHFIDSKAATLPTELNEGWVENSLREDPDPAEHIVAARELGDEEMAALYEAIGMLEVFGITDAGDEILEFVPVPVYGPPFADLDGLPAS